MTNDANAEKLGYRLILGGADAFMRLIGPFLSRQEREGDFTYAFRVREAHANASGAAHGGMVMSFAEMAIANAVAANGGNASGALSWNAAFLAPANPGDLVECRPKLIRSTGEIIFAGGHCYVGESLVLSVKGLWPTLGSRSKSFVYPD